MSDFEILIDRPTKILQFLELYRLKTRFYVFKWQNRNSGLSAQNDLIDMTSICVKNSRITKTSILKIGENRDFGLPWPQDFKSSRVI